MTAAQLARRTLTDTPSHVTGLIAHATVDQAELYDNCIRNSARKLFRSALVVYPKRMADPNMSSPKESR